MRGELQEELLHRVQEGRPERHRRVLPHPARQGAGRRHKRFSSSPTPTRRHDIQPNDTQHTALL
jgi:hypothetical protein